MDYYYNEFDKLQDEFHEVMHDYPLFQEMIDEIYDKDIKEINELLDKNDEFYLKKAISKLKNIIDYVKKTSKEIDNEYDKFDKLARTWEKIKFVNVEQSFLDNLNSKINKANELIKSHDLKDIIEANSIMEKIIKEVRS